MDYSGSGIKYNPFSGYMERYGGDDCNGSSCNLQDSKYDTLNLTKDWYDRNPIVGNRLLEDDVSRGKLKLLLELYLDKLFGN